MATCLGQRWHVHLVVAAAPDIELVHLDKPSQETPAPQLVWKDPVQNLHWAIWLHVLKKYTNRKHHHTVPLSAHTAWASHPLKATQMHQPAQKKKNNKIHVRIQSTAFKITNLQLLDLKMVTCSWNLWVCLDRVSVRWSGVRDPDPLELMELTEEGRVAAFLEFSTM